MNFCQPDPGDIMIPNFYHGNWEADIFRLTKKGMIIEYEIKLSKADFIKDFTKKSTEYEFERDATHKIIGLTDGKVTNKHDQIISGSRCHKFYFVLPESLFEKIKDSIPKHAGVVTFEERSTRLIIRKAAPVLSKNQVPDSVWKSLAISLSWRENKWRRRMDFQKAVIEDQNARIKNLENYSKNDTN
jgi:hypothetical protein